jgi:hypothetical protein
MKTERGWWALAGVVVGSVLLLLAGYVGAYYAMVDGIEVAASGPPSAVAIYPQCSWLDLGSFFEPIHEIDRKLRPGFWNP